MSPDQALTGSGSQLERGKKAAGHVGTARAKSHRHDASQGLLPQMPNAQASRACESSPYRRSSVFTQTPGSHAPPGTPRPRGLISLSRTTEPPRVTPEMPTLRAGGHQTELNVARNSFGSPPRHHEARASRQDAARKADLLPQAPPRTEEAGERRRRGFLSPAKPANSSREIK